MIIQFYNEFNCDQLHMCGILYVFRLPAVSSGMLVSHTQYIYRNHTAQSIWNMMDTDNYHQTYLSYFCHSRRQSYNIYLGLTLFVCATTYKNTDPF